jgi:pimeloyl-[acyl-carrier protein] methyl ester esterase
LPPAPIILLPGLDGTGDLFAPLIPMIPAEHRIRIISYPTDQPLSYDDLHSLMETKLASDTATILIAESFSGPLAIRYAAAHPDRVSALILCATFIRSPVPRWLRFFITPLFFCLPLPAIALRYFLLGPAAAPILVDQLRQTLRKVSPNVLARRVKEVLNVDCSDALRQCKAPILYLVAANDRLVLPASINPTHSLRPDRSITPLASPHLLLQIDPHAAWQAIAHFLTTLPSS